MSLWQEKKKDGSKVWFYRFQYMGRRYCGIGGTTKTQALRTQEKIRAQAISGEYDIQQKVRNPFLKEFAGKFLKRRIHMASYERQTILIKHLLRYFKNKSLAEVSPEDVEEYKLWRKTEGVSNATVNREVAMLKRMFNLAITWGDSRKNPVSDVTFLREPPKKERYVTKEEAAKLIKVASDHFKPMLVAVFNTGMRLQEVLSLKWDSVKIRDIGSEIEVVYGKGAKKRYIPLNETMIDLLNSLEKQGEYVFPGTHGKRLLLVRRPLETAIKRSGIEWATFHDFRHSWASWMIEAGNDPYVVMEIGGWSDMKTLTRYLHRCSVHTHQAVKKLDGILNASNMPVKPNVLEIDDVRRSVS